MDRRQPGLEDGVRVRVCRMAACQYRMVPRYYLAIALTALAMGLRSATMWRLEAVFKTTLVTGTLVTFIRFSTLGGGTG